MTTHNKGRNVCTQKQNTDIDVYLTCENPDCPRPGGVFLVKYACQHARKYCSSSCSAIVQHQKSIKRNTDIDTWLTCANPDCPRPSGLFLVDFFYQDKRKYCSKSCSIVDRNQKTIKRNTKIGVWITCKNLECPLPDRVFLAKFTERNDRNYCSKGCGIVGQNQKSGKRNIKIGVWLTCENSDCPLPDGVFLARFNERNARNYCSQNCSFSNLEEKSCRSARMKIAWTNIDFIDKMARVSSSTIKKNHESNVYGKAQRLLFDELKSRIPDIFGWEKKIILMNQLEKNITVIIAFIS